MDLLAVKRGSQCVSCVSMQWLRCIRPSSRDRALFQAPEEHKAKVGKQVLWQCLKVREGRRKGARAWQDHFVDYPAVAGVSRQLLAESAVPCNLVFEGVRNCSGLACGRWLRDGSSRKHEESILSSRHQRNTRVIDEDGMWVGELDKYQESVLSMMNMYDRRVKLLTQS